MKALVIEGGGMKAAYANGVLTAFEWAGYHPWDVVIGTSAGGALAAWYSAGQAEYAEETWPYASDPRIMSIRRALTGQGPLLDHEALLTIVYEDEHPLDVEAVRDAPWPVIVTAADCHTGEMAYVDIRGEDVISWLKATGRLPIGSGPPVPIHGQEWVDGGVIDPVPTKYVVNELGATDVTLITNKPIGKKKNDAKFLVERVAKKYPALREGLLLHQEIKFEGVQFVRHPPEGVEGTIIAPTNKTRLHRLSRNLEHIQEGLDLGHADGEAYLRSLDTL